MNGNFIVTSFEQDYLSLHHVFIFSYPPVLKADSAQKCAEGILIVWSVLTISAAAVQYPQLYVSETSVTKLTRYIFIAHIQSVNVPLIMLHRFKSVTHA